MTRGEWLDGAGARPATLNGSSTTVANTALDEAALREVVDRIRETVNALADERRQAGDPVQPEVRAALAEEVTAAWLREENLRRVRARRRPLDPDAENRLRERVRAAVSALGPVARFLDSPQWSDVEVNGAYNVVCTARSADHREEFTSPFTSEAEVFEWVAEQAALAGRRFDESNPSVRFRLPNGVRVHAIAKVTSLPHIDFRLFLPGLDTLDGLADAGMFADDVGELLRCSAAVCEPIGVIFSGGTGNGKTTLLRAWMNAHPHRTVLDRVVTVEDEQELFLDRRRFRNLVEFEAREPNVDGKGEYSMERYLSHDLRRQTPQRVALGELKPDGGVLPLLLALGQGIAQGVATTIHAPTAEDVLPRVRTYAAFGARRVDETTVLETVAASVDLVVHVARVRGRRVVASVREYADYRDGTVTSAELWRWNPAATRAIRTEVDTTDRLVAKLTAAGLDPNLLDRDPSGARP
jgi:pilus assembly protein CpaF